jgi:hypothetical protein
MISKSKLALGTKLTQKSKREKKFAEIVEQWAFNILSHFTRFVHYTSLLCLKSVKIKDILISVLTNITKKKLFTLDVCPCKIDFPKKLCKKNCICKKLMILRHPVFEKSMYLSAWLCLCLWIQTKFKKDTYRTICFGEERITVLKKPYVTSKNSRSPDCRSEIASPHVVATNREGVGKRIIAPINT